MFSQIPEGKRRIQRRPEKRNRPRVVKWGGGEGEIELPSKLMYYGSRASAFYQNLQHVTISLKERLTHTYYLRITLPPGTHIICYTVSRHQGLIFLQCIHLVSLLFY